MCGSWFNAQCKNQKALELFTCWLNVNNLYAEMLQNQEGEKYIRIIILNEDSDWAYKVLKELEDRIWNQFNVFITYKRTGIF